jgi:hypothetical protein
VQETKLRNRKDGGLERNANRSTAPILSLLVLVAISFGALGCGGEQSSRPSPTTERTKQETTGKNDKQETTGKEVKGKTTDKEGKGKRPQPPPPPPPPDNQGPVGDYLGYRMLFTMSTECYSFARNGQVELRHSGLPQVNERGVYRNGKIFWENDQIIPATVSGAGQKIRINGVDFTKSFRQ